MGKQNMTYKITKTYHDGHQWTDKVVGKSAYDKYQRKITKNMASPKGRIACQMVTVPGHKESDVEKKEEINYKTFKNMRENDWFRDKEIEEEDE